MLGDLCARDACIISSSPWLQADPTASANGSSAVCLSIKSQSDFSASAYSPTVFALHRFWFYASCFFWCSRRYCKGGTLLRVGEQLNNRVLGRAGHLWKLAREMFLNWFDVSLERGCCTEAALANTSWSTAVVRLFFCVDVNLYVAFR